MSGPTAKSVALYLTPDNLSISFDILDPAVSPSYAPTPSPQSSVTGPGTAFFGVTCDP